MRAWRRSRPLAPGAVLVLLLVAGMLLAPVLAAPSPATAASGISITGSFYRQVFEIPRGGSAFGPSIYVMVSNQGADAFNVRMVTAAVTTDNVPEPGISINLSRVSFSLQPGAQQRVDIRVDVAEGVPAGQYSISVTAESFLDTTEGISLSGSAGQTASLTVAGEAATAAVSTVGPSGQPVIAQVRLFRMVDGSGYEVASSNTGSLQARVAPGSFSAEAYSLTTGEQLCEPAAFDVAGGESRTITLTARTVYFENDFVVNANYDSQTGELLNARTLATLTNVLEMMGNTEVRLVVTRNGDPLEEITVLGPLALPVGQTGVPWNYIPAEGWKGGRYAFSYRLYVGGLFVAQTAEQALDVGSGGGVSSWLWIIFAALGVVGAGGLGLAVFSVLKNRRKGEGQPRKDKGKKRKEEKRARQPEKPAGVPEPAVTAQPPPKAGPPVQPVTQPEPARASKPAPAAKPSQKPAVTPAVQQPKPVQAQAVPQAKQGVAAKAPQAAPAQGAKPVMAQAAKPAKPAQTVQQPRPVSPAAAAPQQPATARPAAPAQPARAEQPAASHAAPLATVSSLKARMASLGQDQRLGRDTDEDEEEAEVEAQDAAPEDPVQESVEVTMVADEVPPAEAPPVEAAAEAVTEPEPWGQEPAAGDAAQGSAESETHPEPEPEAEPVVGTEPPRAVQAVRQPDEAEVPAPAPEEVAPQEAPAADTAVPPEEASPVEEAAPVSEAAFAEDAGGVENAPVAADAAPSEEVSTGDLDTEAETAPPPPLMKSSFVEAAKLRMQAREHAAVDGGGKDEG